jgi:hypothetical protein
MALCLFLSQAYDTAWLEPKGVKSETARVDTVVAPASVTFAEVKELAGRAPVAIEVDAQGGLLGAREGSGEAAGAVENIVEASGELWVLDDLGRDLSAYVSGVHHRSTYAPDPSPLVCGPHRPTGST